MGLFSHTRTRPILDPQGRPLPGSVAVMEKIRLGGLEQLVVIRGHNTQNPILLWLHGGPGASDLGAVQRFNGELERYYTVVHWSQRCTAQSYDAHATAETLSPRQFLADSVELARLMLQRFGQEKLFVAGQSIGSTFGLLFAQQHPELVHAYVGVNQILDRAPEEARSLRLALEHARAVGNRRAVAALEKLPQDGPTLVADLDALIVLKTWTRKLGLVTHDPKFFGVFAKAVVLAPEFSWRYLLRFVQGIATSMRLSFLAFCRHNFFVEVPELQVPIFLVAGDSDRYTSRELAEAYLAQLKAPHKEMIVLENAGHIACFEQPAPYNEFMITRVRPVADQSRISQAG